MVVRRFIRNWASYRLKTILLYTTGYTATGYLTHLREQREKGTIPEEYQDPNHATNHPERYKGLSKDEIERKVAANLKIGTKLACLSGREIDTTVAVHKFYERMSNHPGYLINRDQGWFIAGVTGVRLVGVFVFAWFASVLPM